MQYTGEGIQSKRPKTKTSQVICPNVPFLVSQNVPSIFSLYLIKLEIANIVQAMYKIRNIDEGFIYFIYLFIFIFLMGPWGISPWQVYCRKYTYIHCHTHASTHHTHTHIQSFVHPHTHLYKMKDTKCLC